VQSVHIRQKVYLACEPTVGPIVKAIGTLGCQTLERSLQALRMTLLDGDKAYRSDGIVGVAA
jgi:hypothetical protein